MNYHIVTLGCQMNVSDSERVTTVLNGMGMNQTENEEDSLILGIVACSVRQKAIDKVYSRISKWNEWKNSKPLITFVTGCILPDDREKFMKLFDLVFPMNELTGLPEMIELYGIVTPPKTLGSHEITEFNDHMLNFWKVAPLYNSDFEAFVPIQNGCDKFCTFCAVPYTRGREISRPSGEIISEVKSLVTRDYKSITLLGQNVNSYGLDKKDKEILFPALLRQIGELGITTGKEFRVYFTSPHPRDMTEEVIDVIANYPVLAKQIQLPLQSGDDLVLIHMNRKYRVDEYRKVVRYIRDKLPEATLFTDIITGFAGETAEQFNNTLKAVQEFRYNMAFIAMYSPRPGAVSSRWVDDVPQSVKRERLHILNTEVGKFSLEYNMKLIGKKLRVLITGCDDKKMYLYGLTEGKINVRINCYDSSMIGKFIDVHVTGASDFSIAGEPVFVQQLGQREFTNFGSF